MDQFTHSSSEDVRETSYLRKVEFSFQNKTFRIERFPESGNHTLRAWSAADELLLEWAATRPPNAGKTAVFHDRFGFLAAFLAERLPVFVAESHSQEAALQHNFRANGLDPEALPLIHPLDPFPERVGTALLPLPKSMELFRLFLHQLAPALSSDSELAVGFMTRHFNAQMLEIAGQYFEGVLQSRAKKKARLLLLSKPKVRPELDLIGAIPFEGHEPLKQYPGVFSSGRIDTATRFLLEHLPEPRPNARVLDLACGNGVLGVALQKLEPEAEIHLLDDSWLALESAKLNIGPGNGHFHYAHSLEEFPGAHFDLVISNPPFHAGHEIDISVPLRLFGGVAPCLKPGGSFRLVANRHLNYRTHLGRMFSEVELVAENRKFEIIEARH